MTNHNIVVPIVALIITAVSTAAVGSTIHEELVKFGFPPGLLPNNVESYSVSSDGNFVVNLADTCYVKFIDLVFYDKKISGKLSFSGISQLNGIEVKKLFTWLSITGITLNLDGKTVEFQAGFLSQKIPTSLFAEIPHCRKSPSLRGVGGFVAEDASMALAQV